MILSFSFNNEYSQILFNCCKERVQSLQERHCVDLTFVILLTTQWKGSICLVLYIYYYFWSCGRSLQINQSIARLLVQVPCLQKLVTQKQCLSSKINKFRNIHLHWYLEVILPETIYANLRSKIVICLEFYNFYENVPLIIASSSEWSPQQILVFTLSE